MMGIFVFIHVDTCTLIVRTNQQWKRMVFLRMLRTKNQLSISRWSPNLKIYDPSGQCTYEELAGVQFQIILHVLKESGNFDETLSSIFQA